MKKVFLLALLLTSTVCSWAAANPKATGDFSFTNPQSPTNTPPATVTFNAINTAPTGLGAKGSLIYTDPNVTYTMDVQFLKVDGSDAYFAGQVTSVTPTGGYGGCCKVGNWVFYHVHDGGQPGIGVDTSSGEDLTQGETTPSVNVDFAFAMNAVAKEGQPLNQAYIGPAYPITDGNILVHGQ